MMQSVIINPEVNLKSIIPYTNLQNTIPLAYIVRLTTVPIAYIVRMTRDTQDTVQYL